MNPSHRPDKFVLQVARTVLAEAAQKPWLASLLAQQKDWLEKLSVHIQRLTRPQRLGLRRKLASGMAAAVLLASLVGAPPVYAAGVVGNGTAGSCTEVALLAAVFGGGTVTFDCGAAPHTIILVNKIDPANSVTIDGAGLITLDINGGSRILDVNNGITVNLKNLTLQNGYIYSGDGGAVLVDTGSTLNVSKCTFSNNESFQHGGAIALYAGTADIKDSTFYHNKGMYGGAISNYKGTLTVDSSTFDRNNSGSGGAVYFEGPVGSPQGSILINNSTLTGNKATYGGALYGKSGLTSVTVTQSTITANGAALHRGGGLYSYAPITLKNTLIVGNTGDDCKFATGGSVISEGYNIDSDGTCVLGSTSDVTLATDFLHLQPLADNGGPTQTVALGQFSDAINTIPLNVNGCTLDTSIDQRGAVRASGTDRGGLSCDVGAYEYGSSQNPSVVALQTFTTSARPAQGGLGGVAAAAASALAALAYFFIRRLDQQEK